MTRESVRVGQNMCFAFGFLAAIKVLTMVFDIFDKRLSVFGFDLTWLVEKHHVKFGVGTNPLNAEIRPRFFLWNLKFNDFFPIDTFGL